MATRIAGRYRWLAALAAIALIAGGIVLAYLNEVPDRNGAWRDWQRRHSGFWPDAPWENGPWDADAECVSFEMLPVRSFTYVLHYRDRDPVPIIASGCHGWTDGTRTRIPITYTPPHLTEEFVALYESQTGG